MTDCTDVISCHVLNAVSSHRHWAKPAPLTHICPFTTKVMQSHLMAEIGTRSNLMRASFWHYFQKIAKDIATALQGMTKSLIWPHTFYENEMQRENPRLLVNPSNKSSQETQKIYSGKIHKPRNWLKAFRLLNSSSWANTKLLPPSQLLFTGHMVHPSIRVFQN